MKNNIYKFCQTLVSKINKQRQQRENIYITGRKVLMLSKTVIFNLHDEKINEAQKNLADALELAIKIETKFKNLEILESEGSWQASLEELAEAHLFMQIFNKLSLKELPLKSIKPSTYLSALADVSGELTRQAVLQATKGNKQVVEVYCEAGKEIVNGLSSAYLTGILRQKSDDAKRNLKRLEQIRYELSLNSKIN